MQIQVCRQCGNRNTVTNKPLKNCNYCGSNDLEPVSETIQSADGYSVSSEKNSVFPFKWLILLMVLGFLLGAFYWVWQNYLANTQQKTAPVYPSFIDSTANTKAPTSDSNKLVISDESAAGNGVIITNIGDAEALNLTVESEDNNPENRSIVKAENNELLADGQLELIEGREDITSENTLTSTAANRATQENSPTIKPVMPVPSVAIVLPDISSNINKTINNEEIKDKNTTNKNVNKEASSATQSTVANKPKIKKSEATINKAAAEQTSLAQNKRPENKPLEIKQLQIKPLQIKPLQIKPLQIKPKPIVQAKPVNQPKPLNQVISFSTIESNRARNAKRKLDSKNGVVIDTATALMWMTCSLGQRWNGQACVGESNEYLWSEAMSEAKKSSHAGYSDWRLPTRQELNDIVSCTSGRLPSKLDAKGKMIVKNGQQMNGQCMANFSKPTIDVKVFPNTESAFYWSYSHSAVNNYSVWGVFFSKGQLLSFNRSNVGFVRLVRSN